MWLPQILVATVLQKDGLLPVIVICIFSKFGATQYIDNNLIL